MTPENLLSEWARLLVVSLADAGLRDVVVSPGSRSTPLVAAVLAAKRFHTVSVVDERSAAFYALGRAKATGVPAAVICTSGSAAANYFPAVVEASSARVPLLVVTADRPFELHDCGASQTMDQTRLYGDHVRRFVDLGLPDGEPAALVALRRRAVQSLTETTFPEPGPVHLNFRARKPLEPTLPTTDAGRALASRVDGVLARPVTRTARAVRHPDPELIAETARRVRAAKRGLIVCGPSEIGQSAGAAVCRLARASGFPVYAEATSQLRFSGTEELPAALRLDGLDVLLRVPAFRAAFAPDLVIQVGEPPTSGAWERLVAERAPERHVFARFGWPDPASNATTLVVADVEPALAALAAALGSAPDVASAWSEGLSRSNAAAWTAVEGVLAHAGGLSEGGVLRTIAEALPAGALLGVGNSLPVRHVDAFCRARPSAEISVWSQRGVSGIDGVVSSAAGAADAAGRPTVLVLGDVSALHDMGGFAVAKDVSVPFVVVVLNNGGGRIFEQLPLAAAGLDPAAERFWTTPHSARFDSLAGVFGVPYAVPDSPETLRTALLAALARPGCTLLEAKVAPHGARDEYARLVTATQAALAGIAP
jgi:2-succinyl-5-enolpyruvyl-6-hydroxy-3-cyclohexene-1-carboxylate synthase